MIISSTSWSEHAAASQLSKSIAPVQQIMGSQNKIQGEEAPDIFFGGNETSKKSSSSAMHH
jgi:hypothetical protein